ncbi:GumC family protein [Hyphobacterium sp.]|uniref:GumC family protein n=1 Tax=Hyphobacterium sp. TaxID=2004662 RepID=UPI003B51F191
MSRAYSGSGQSPPAPPGPEGENRRSLDLFDLIEMVWSQRVIILVVFLLLFAFGASASILMLDRSYEARARLLVLLDDEDLTPGAAGSGDGFILEQVLQSEAEILNSETVRRRALDVIGPAGVLPAGGTEAQALRALRQSFSVERSPNASVLIPVVEGDDPARSEQTLNAIIDAYIAYRQVVLTGDGASGISERRVQADTAHGIALAALDQFLQENDITDYEADREAAIARVSALQTQLLTAQSEAQAASSAASALQARIAGMPETIELYVESSAENQLAELRLERERLLARYLETAPAVVAINREIAELEEFITGGGVAGLGNTRTGVNEVRSALVEEQMRQEVRASSQTTLAATLRRQWRAAQQEVQRLRDLAPEYRRLAQDVAATETAATGLATQQAEAEARQSLAPGSADAVRIVERAYAPPEGSSLKKLGIAASFVFAAGAAMLLGLLRGYWINHVSPHASGRPLPRDQAAAEAVSHEPVPMPSQVAGIPVLIRMPQRGAALGRR